MTWCSKFTEILVVWCNTIHAQIILSFITKEHRFWAINYVGEHQDRCYIASPFFLPGWWPGSQHGVVQQMRAMQLFSKLNGKRLGSRVQKSPSASANRCLTSRQQPRKVAKVHKVCNNVFVGRCSWKVTPNRTYISCCPSITVGWDASCVTQRLALVRGAPWDWTQFSKGTP